MRAFNEREKKIIDKIVLIKSNSIQTCTKFLQDNFFTVDSKMALILRHDTKNAWFYFEPSLMLNEDQMMEKNHQLFELLILLAYLKENRYISIIPPSNNPATLEAIYSGFNKITINGNKVNLSENGEYLLSTQPDEIKDSNGIIILKGGQIHEFYDFIYSNMFGLIFPSEELIQLSKHHFKSKEDRKHIQNLWASWIGISIALLLGLFGIWNPYDSNHKDAEKINNGIANVSVRLENLNQLNSNSLNTLKSIDKNVKPIETKKKY
jgi:hypothetical protein